MVRHGVPEFRVGVVVRLDGLGVRVSLGVGYPGDCHGGSAATSEHHDYASFPAVRPYRREGMADRATVRVGRELLHDGPAVEKWGDCPVVVHRDRLWIVGEE